MALLLFAPNVSNALVGYRGVDNRVRNRTMAHERLQRPRIDSTSRQGVTSSMPHVGMNRIPLTRLRSRPIVRRIDFHGTARQPGDLFGQCSLFG